MPHTINFNEIQFPENHFLHKEKKDNIHIYNLRRSLPRVIISEIFEKDILPALSQSDKEFILTFYIKTRFSIGNHESGGEVIAYVLRSLPISFSVAEMDSILHDRRITEPDKQFILKCYTKWDNDDSYLLASNFAEVDELRIARILQIRWLLINDKDKKRISDIFDSNTILRKQDIFIANMHVDPGHEYFYEHKLDHVPGMMVIETARQMFVACAHIYGLVPTAGVFFTLNAMNVSFTEYVWMSYPIRIELRMKKTTLTEEGYWHKCSCSVIFYQEFKEKARVEIDGMTIKMKILENIIIKRHVDHALNSGLLPGLQGEILLRDARNDTTIIGAILDISPKHLLVELTGDITLDAVAEYDFRVSLEKHYYCYGVCNLKEFRKKTNRTVASFFIRSIDSDGDKNINEVIKRLCHIREQKGIL